MGLRHNKFRRMLYFLEECERTQHPFSLEELAEATGYKLSSIRTYYGKRLKNVLVAELADGRFRAEGISVFNEHTFIDYMTQRSAPPSSSDGAVEEDDDDDDDAPGVAPEEVMIEGLLERAASAMRAALGLFHDSRVPDRLTLTCLGALQAWDLLLKAEIARARGLAQLCAVNAPMTPLSLQELLLRCYPNAADPTRKNIAWLMALRDQHAYLLVPELEPHLSPLLQACALNFRKRYEAMAGRRLFERGAGALYLMGDGAIASLDELRVRYGDMIASRIEDMVLELRQDERESAHPAFMTPGAWRLELRSDAQEQPVNLARGKDALAAAAALDHEQPSRPYPYTASEVVHAINKLLPYERRLDVATIAQIDARHGVRAMARSRYAIRLDDDPERYLYAQAYVHWVVRSLRRDPQWLQRPATQPIGR